jgi:hypothetical protein
VGQIDVYEYLKKLQEQHDYSFYSAKEIEIALKKQGLSNGAIWGVSRDLNQLYRYGNVEITGYDDKHPFKNFIRKYRLRLKPLSK